MEVSRKLLLYGIVAFVGLVMQVIIFTSPGWTHVYIPVREKDTTPLALPLCPHEEPVVDIASGDGKHVPKPPCRVVRPGDRKDDHDSAEKHRSSEEKGDDDDSAEKHGLLPTDQGWGNHRHHEPHVCVSLGLWYLVTCSHPSMNGKKKHSCHVSSYEKMKEIVFPSETASLTGMVKNIGKYSDKVLFEFRVEVTVAMLSSFFGIIALLIYTRSGAKARNSAILSFISLLVSGVITFVAIGKVASILMMSKSFLEQDPDMAKLHVHIGFPWCLVVALLSAVLTLIATFGMLLILSRGYNPKDFPRPYEIEGESNYKRFSNDQGIAPGQEKA